MTDISNHTLSPSATEHPFASARRFSSADDTFILAHYGTHRLHWIAEQLGRSFPCLQQRTYALIRQGKLDPHTRFWHRRWTPADDAELRGRLGWDSPRTIARVLHRTVEAVHIRAVRLGLSQHPRWLTARAVGDLFRVDAKTVRIWIDKDWLRAEQSEIRAGGHARKWRIEGDAIRDFIAQYPSYYERRRITDPYWRKLADEAAVQMAAWVTVPQAARQLQVGKKTIARHIARGWLPAEQQAWSGGYRWLIPRSALASFERRRPRIEGLRYVKGRGGALPRNRAASDRISVGQP